MDYQGNNLRDFLQLNGHVVLQRVNNNHNLRSFTEKEIEHITNGYSTLLGKGAFSEVYRGVLDDQRLVAVKKYKDGTRKEDLAKEVIVHSQINHKNVVRLLGCCTEENALAIVMELICNGNLGDLLHCSTANGHVSFPLDRRLSIAIELAEVLSNMHSMYSPILHGDIKPDNILLDENFAPKISDFGIARLISSNGTQQTENIIGSIGYLDPLFSQTGILTPKSDIYSFGVVLVEMITRKKAAAGNTYLIQNFIEALKRGKKVRQMFDKEIVDGKKSIKVLDDIAKLAAQCLILEDKLRPEMVEVADRLRKCRKDLQLRRREAMVESSGNTSVGPGITKNGFFQSVSTVLWKAPQDGGSTGRAPPPASDMQVAVQSKVPQLGSVLKRKTENLKDTYSLGRRLGQGASGITYLCVERSTGKEFACKSILKRKLVTEDDVEDVRREIQILYHLAGHPNMISIRGAYEDAVAVHLVMELCAGGELFDRIVQRGHYTERKAAELASVIVGVIEVCHSMGVVHRDLKPENFLFVDQKEESALKIVDFNLSIFFQPGQIFTDVVGSPYYVAPEVLKKKHGPEADVWSAGVIIYILLCGVPPFWADSEQGIFEEVLRGRLDFESEPWPSISEGAKDLVRRMLIRDPRKRLTAHEVLRHPWVQVGGLAPDKPLDSAVLSRMKQFSATNKLKKMALRVIAENLPEDEIAGLKEMFKMIDTDNNGTITFEELKVGLKKVGANLQESEIQALMQAADMDNSGTIDYGEFIAATLHLNKVEREDHLFTAFQYFDKDGSGYITADELQLACEEFGLGDVKLEDMIGEVDQNNKGRIDYNEFVAMMQKHTLGPKRTASASASGNNYPINTTNKEQTMRVLAIPLDELKEITRNFSYDNLVVQSSHAQVFFGAMKDHRKCAVKMLDNPDVDELDDEFLLKVQFISKLEHNNVVQLLSYCIEENIRALVYEYSPMGSLHDILHGKKGVLGARPGQLLSWTQRVKIALCSAEGLEFIHEKAQHCTTRRVMKSSNILLFDNNVAKIIGDVVVFKSNRDEMNNPDPLYYFIPPPSDSDGYVAPEYLMTEERSNKSDVFSFGIVLLELLTGRKAHDRTRPHAQQNLMSWATPKIGTRRVHQCADPRLRGEYPRKDFAKMARIASRCVQYQAESRPSMSMVVKDLRSLLPGVSGTASGPRGE